MATPGHFLFLGNQDLNGILRGRSVPAGRMAEAMADGLPWVPANLTIGALNGLPPDNPFGPLGEIRFVPDPAACVTLGGHQGGPAFDLALCDARQMDGTPWACCPRTALKSAIADLAATGLTMKVALEHEFTVHGLNESNHVAFSLSAGRVIAPLGQRVLDTLERSGIALEQFQAEYGASQFEISSVPTDPLTAADRTVLTLETIRDTAHCMGLRASFLPKPSLDEVGNGVHIHFSLWDGARNVTCHSDWLTNRSAPFVAGLIDHAESLVPLTVLSANSYARLRPHSWVGAFTCVGLRNREAMIRLVPRGPAVDGSSPKASLEYRVSDATANVYLALAAIIRAGLAGIAAGSPAPPDVQHDPDTLPPEQRAAWRVRPLPASLDAALTRQALQDATTWFGPDLAQAYYSCRRSDAVQAAGYSFDALAAKLALVY
ncbi:MAG: glutamine synthetase family protein [Pseudotabrizicola sp.]|uniref:glutamine synthetase family protein n=1 Tax=Pseudotabrizicola sp. TaxID=2939647 RepID=UPI0027242A7C|nr:glutamine synthetase family protein [Pseudotabrizicola sp.]MDO9636961.1 glutamine synthetase family protein [Pseudotabrizicola sp.]